MTLQLAKISQKKKRFHVSYLYTFAPSILSHIYYYRQSQYPPKSAPIRTIGGTVHHETIEGVMLGTGLTKSCLLDHGPRLINLLRLILLINRGMRCQAPIESEKVLVMALWLHSAAPNQCLVRSQDSRIG